MTQPLPKGHRLPATDLTPACRTAIAAYTAASGDDNPLHHDPDLAQRAGFADVLVPGLMIQGQMAEALARLLPDARIESFEARFVLPVTAGQPLTLTARVVAHAPDGAAILRLTAAMGGQVAVLGEARARAAPQAPAGHIR